MSHADQLENMIQGLTQGRWVRTGNGTGLEFVVETDNGPDVTFIFDGAEKLRKIEVAEDPKPTVSSLDPGFPGHNVDKTAQVKAEIEKAKTLILAPLAREALDRALELLG